MHTDTIAIFLRPSRRDIFTSIVATQTVLAGSKLIVVWVKASSDHESARTSNLISGVSLVELTTCTFLFLASPPKYFNFRRF